MAHSLPSEPGPEPAPAPLAEQLGEQLSPSDAPPVLVSIDAASVLSVVVGLAAVFVLFALFRGAAGTLTQIGIGLLLAFALNPLVVAVRRRTNASRRVAVGLVSFVGVLAFGLIAFGLGPPAVRQAEEFGRELPETVEKLYDFPIIGDPLRDANASERVREWAEELPGRIDSDTIARITRALVDGVLTALVVLLVAFTVLVDGDVLVARLRRLFPPSQRPRAEWVGRVFYKVVCQYFAGSLLVAMIAGLFILTVGLAFGVPLAPLAAIWMVMVNLIPQIGGFLGGGFFTILAFTEGIGTGIACLALYLVYMNLENHVITPTIVGEAVNLSPPTTMLAALIGAAAAGVPGALVATPLCGTVKALYVELRFGRSATEREPPIREQVSSRIPAPIRRLLQRLGRGRG